jgi:hypothetical protein
MSSVDNRQEGQPVLLMQMGILAWSMCYLQRSPHGHQKSFAWGRVIPWSISSVDSYNFCDLEAHAQFQNHMSTTSARNLILFWCTVKICIITIQESPWLEWEIFWQQSCLTCQAVRRLFAVLDTDYHNDYSNFLYIINQNAIYQFKPIKTAILSQPNHNLNLTQLQPELG